MVEARASGTRPETMQRCQIDVPEITRYHGARPSVVPRSWISEDRGFHLLTSSQAVRTAMFPVGGEVSEGFGTLKLRHLVHQLGLSA